MTTLLEKLRPIYLIAGEEHLLVLEAADALRKKIRSAGFSEREILDVEAGFDWNDLSMAAASMSLFSSQRLLELRLPTGKPGTQGSEAIRAYCDNPPIGTVLLITCNQWSKSHEVAWFEAVRKVGEVRIIWPMKSEDLPRWLTDRARHRGLEFGRDAIDLIVQRVEGNLLAAAQEIEKLALLAKGKKLDAKALDDLVADSARFDVFQLADAVLLGDTERSLRVLAHLRADGDQVPGLLAWIINQIMVVARVSALVSNRVPLNVAFNQEKVWRNREPMIKQAVSRGSADFWQARLIDLGRIDRIAKGRKQNDGDDAWREFERFIVAACVPKAALQFAYI